MIIFDNNYILSLTASDLTASSENATLTAANILDPRKDIQWRTAAGTTHTLVIDFGEVKSVTAAAVLFKTSAAITSIDIEFNTSDSWGSPAATEALASGAVSYGVVGASFDANSYRYARLVVVIDSSNTLDVHALHLGTHFTPANGPAVGATSLSYIDKTQQFETPQSSVYSVAYDPVFELNFDSVIINDAARELWNAFIKNYGLKSYCFVSLDATSYSESMLLYGKFAATGVSTLVSNQSGLLWRSAGYSFKGVREIV